MRFHVRHETLYRYDAPVRLAPHVLRLNPRPVGVRIASRALRVTRAPVETHDFVDAFGNLLTRVGFDGETQELRIESDFALDTLAAHDPPPRVEGVPVLPWPMAVGDDLDVYRREPRADPSVHAYAGDRAARSGYDAFAFLLALMQDVFANTDRGIRWEGAARSPAETLASRQGACRDVTVLFLAACRSLGIPGRFVSGYQAHAQTPDGERHLHAWAEVHLPGVGWRGYDAMHGVVVTDGHVALCAAPDQAGTMPVEGSFSFVGPARTSTLDTSVKIVTE